MQITATTNPIEHTRTIRSDTGKPHNPDRKKRSDATGKMRTILRRTKQFVGWDGEGYTVAGIHHYALFGNSLGARISGRLEWRDCIRLLFDAPANAHHVIYAGTYDIVMMFRNEQVVQRMLHGETVYLDQYRITYLRGKMLRITDRELKETRTLYDVFTFFGSSFVKACREYLGDSDTLTEIEAMKLQRNTFTKDDVLAGGVEGYMSQELELLVDLCNALRERLAMVNIHPHQWHGPGAVASTVLKYHQVGKCKGEYDDEFRQVAESAYYGGRFEQFKRGAYLGPVYQYDIRSAYPNAMRYLPDLTSATWAHTTHVTRVNHYGLYHVDYNPKEAHPIGYLPYRNRHGSIYYPKWVKGWYWGVEIPEHMYPYIDQGYQPYIPSDVRPFAFVEEMYEQRAKLKRANQPQQLALKLALNSLYGKLAQSKGARYADGKWHYPTFHEIVWAGFITAYTRRLISDGLHSIDPAHIIATETDSIFTTEPLAVHVGQKLGEWDCDTLEGIKYIQSGVSLVKTEGTWKFKTRGFTVKRHEDEVAIWSKFLSEKPHILRVKQTRFGTDPRQKTFGQWYETFHNLQLDQNDLEKRIHKWCANCETGKGYNDILHSLIVPPVPPMESVPYKFIWRDEMATMMAELIDYDEPLLKLEYA